MPSCKNSINRILTSIANFICRDRTIMLEDARYFSSRNSSGRINISGIAATTGISRGEISRILKHYGSIATDKVSNGRQNPINRILAAWHSDTRFLTANKLPAELDLYGR